MANITYRESTVPTIAGSTTAKLTPLTNLEVDANFKALNDDIQTRATSVSVQTTDSNALAYAIALS